MIQGAWATSLSMLVAFSSVAMALNKPQAETATPSASASQPARTVTEPAGNPSPNAPPQKANPEKPNLDPSKDPLESAENENLYTVWDFELDVTALQHEPAGKSLDEFKAQLKFAVILPHGSTEPQHYSGPGEMSSQVLSRGSHSFQAPHRPLDNFHVLAESSRNLENKMIRVVVRPKDAVTYSLTTGEILAPPASSN